MRTLIARAIVLLWSVALMVPAVAYAQGGQNEFVPVNQLPPTEQMPAAPLVIAAYAFVWLATIFFLWSIWRRLGKVQADIDALQRRTPQGTHR